RFVLAIPLLVLATAASAADRIVIEHGVTAPGSRSQVYINVNMTFVVQAPTDDSEASVKAQGRARRLMYESAGKECENLRATTARDCRLQSINVSVNRSYGQQATQGFNASGNFGFEVTLK
ncbi:MAG TPA: hypothetical protein VE224_03765, partial [Pseudolabrys sp.]|nr:hypothetical protein [Pseudolabrys sp.]